MRGLGNTLTGTARQRGMQDAEKTPDQPGSSQPRAGVPGLEVSLRELTQRCFLQLCLAQQLFEARVLLAQLTQFLGLTTTHRPITLAPPAQRRLADTQHTAGLGRTHALTSQRLGLLQLHNNLLRRVLRELPHGHPFCPATSSQDYSEQPSHNKRSEKPRPLQRCTRYVALHPNRRGAMPTDRVQCLQIGCTTPATSSHADLPERTSTDPTGLAGPGDGTQPRQGVGRPRTRQAWLGPAATNPRQPTGPGGNEPPTINRPGSNAPPTTNSARQRTPDSQPGPRAAGPDGPSRRRAERAARGADNERATERAARGAARHQARARRSRADEPGRQGTHTTSPGAGHTYNEAGASRAQQHDRAPAS